MRLLESYISQILLEYSEAEIRKQVDRFVSENPDLAGKEAQVREVINLFDKKRDASYVKSSPKGPDIRQYSWQELISLIGKYNSLRQIFKDAKLEDADEAENRRDLENDLVVVYEGQGLQVFRGASVNQCVAIRRDFEQRTGRKYTWCISASPGSLYGSYRSKDPTPVFYYVFDDSKPATDVLHAFVIHVMTDGTLKRTVATNPGDDPITWEKIVSDTPGLANAKSVIRPKFKTKEERERFGKEKVMSHESLSNLSYDDAEDLVENVEVKLDPYALEALYDKSKDELFKKYINTRDNVALTYGLWGRLPSSTKRVISERHNEDAPVSPVTALFRVLCMGRKKVKTLTLESKVFDELRMPPEKCNDLPEGLTVDGRFSSSDVPLRSLPDNMTAKEMAIYHREFKELPAGLTVGTLDILLCREITEIPDDIKFLPGGKLSMGPEVQRLPSFIFESKLSAGSEEDSAGIAIEGGGKLRFPSNFRLRQLSLANPESLPSDGTVGTLILEYFEPTGKDIVMPEGLRVGVSLKINADYDPKAKIVLPPTLELDGGLSVSTNGQIVLPRSISCRGGVTIRSPKITEISSDIRAHTLTLNRCTKLRSIPTGIRAKWIAIEKTELETLPADLDCEKIYAAGSKLREIPSFGSRKIELSAARTKIAKVLHANFGYLDLEGSDITDDSLPDGLTSTILNVKNTKLTRLPSGLKVGTLLLKGTSIASLPPDAKVEKIHPTSFFRDKKPAANESVALLRALIRETLGR